MLAENIKTTVLRIVSSLMQTINYTLLAQTLHEKATRNSNSVYQRHWNDF